MGILAAAFGHEGNEKLGWEKERVGEESENSARQAEHKPTNVKK
jgi:hypothetical protein